VSKKINVLYFVDRMLRGGIQSFVIENMKHIDKEKIQIDFLLLDDGVEYELEDILKRQGANVYKLKDVWLRKPTDYIDYMKKVDSFFRKHHDYKVVHLHSSSKNFYILKSAKKYKIPVRIAHSHNIEFQSKSKTQRVIGNILKPLLKKYATDYFACSSLAGKWLFGKKENVKVIKNAVDLKRFKFNEKIREKIRKEFNLSDKLVIGHVGRFTNQKNHTFLIDIFYEIHKNNKNTALMLVGTGESEDKIRQKVRNLKLDDSVLFMGFKNNVNELMWAMDIFLFPSLYEGLGLVLIEAQTAGLTCFTSKDVVPLEANVNNLNYISLNCNAQVWAQEILKNKLKRNNNYDKIKQNGYDICDTGKELEEFYINS